MKPQEGKECYAISSSCLYYGPQEIRKITVVTRDLVANKTSCYRTYKRGRAQSPERNGN